MTHPHQLHATAAAWSLQAARQHLAERARQEAADIAAEALAAPALLHSPTWGRRHALGGHGDPTPAMAATTTKPPVNRWAMLAESTTDTLRWLANQLHVPDTGDPLHRLLAAVPTLRPAAAANLTRWLNEADQRIRHALGIEPDTWPLPGAPACPACSVRLLRVQTSAPDSSRWTVVCTAGRCGCAGQECPCGMPVRAEGVGHIWDRSAPLVAGELARLPRRRTRPRRPNPTAPGAASCVKLHR